MSKYRKIFIGLILLFLSQPNSSAQIPQPSPLRLCWHLEAEIEREVPLATNSRGQIFVAMANGDLKSVNSSKGEIQWHAELGGEIIGQMIADESMVFVTSRLGIRDDPGTPEFRIHAISAQTGLTTWRKSFSETPDLIAKSENSLFGIFESGSAFSLDAASGNTKSQMTFSEKIVFAAFSEGKMNVSFAGRNLLVMLSADFSMVDRLTTHEEPRVFSLSKTGLAIIGDENGNLSAYALRSKSRKWHAKTGGEISSIVEIQNGFLVSSFDNFVYLFSNSGKRVWKRRLAGRSIGLPAFSASTAAFATLDGDTAYVLELKKGGIRDRLFLDEGNTFVSNPVFSADSAVFATRRGLVAFGTANCREK